MIQNLSENSPAYHENANIYHIFSQAEDAENKILSFLLPFIKGKRVLDAGCGTGKYLELLSPHVESIVGIDASADQLNIARKRTQDLSNVTLIQADLDGWYSEEFQFDVIIACWVFGTILNEKRRMNAISSLEKSLLAKGKFFLIENAAGGEFEEIRDRVNDTDSRTNSYNTWLCKNAGFTLYSQIDTYFLFESLQQAKQVFSTIWGAKAADRVKDQQIQHKVALFVKEK